MGSNFDNINSNNNMKKEIENLKIYAFFKSKYENKEAVSSILNKAYAIEGSKVISFSSAKKLKTNVVAMGVFGKSKEALQVLNDVEEEMLEELGYETKRANFYKKRPTLIYPFHSKLCI